MENFWVDGRTMGKRIYSTTEEVFRPGESESQSLIATFPNLPPKVPKTDKNDVIHG